MSFILKNKVIELHVDDPLKQYKFPRFDWTGKITTVKYKGLLVSGNEKTHPEEIKTFGRGFYNEFGISMPIGFKEIKKNQWFPKIGVGSLKKDSDDYYFLNNYEIKPANFSIDYSENRIQLGCTSKNENGYAYELEKEITLLDDGFQVSYNLLNTGEKPIITTEYNHNFIAINNNLIGKDYRLSFDFDLDKKVFDEIVNPNDVVTIDSEQISFNTQPESDFFFSNISGGKTVKAKWLLKDYKNKIAISEEASFTTNYINIWGCGHVISPELFIALNILPGERKSWFRRYSISDFS
ncbi:hypothetical protein [Winogradskyella poriferorum]|uniref:hypothetical protein n=1 Tax=Winogradskyella poriferorum TaxID=307627 RepID=UPI003D645934